MDFNGYFEKVIENLANDNNMPFVKTEVVYDTFLYPKVLVELLYTAGVKAEYITKEFPIRNKDLGKGEGYIGVDYLLVNHEEKEFYMVELKTTNDSFDYKQLRKYAIGMEKFNSIIESYIKGEYATDKAYERQRENVKTALHISSDISPDAIDVSEYRDYKKCLLYIVPGFPDYISVKEKVKAAINGKHTKNVKFYNNLYKRLENKKIITISINELIGSKKGCSAHQKYITLEEGNELDQFLLIWYKTMVPLKKQLPITILG